jgi:sugar phosphate isomerase/epimerase
MVIKYFAVLWGNTHLPLDGFLEKARAAGYHGVEIALDPGSMDIHQVRRRCADYGLDLIAQHPYAAGTSPASLLEDYTAKLERILETQPLLVNCHTGKDHFSVAENALFLDAAQRLSASHGITVLHETHRGRFPFCASVTRAYLDAFPSLQFTADFSHWCVVSESLLEDQAAALDAVIPQCGHIHARVGYAEGPQVPHPGAPEYAGELAAHLSWWQRILDHQAARGQATATITCEFGPEPYMQSAPFTRQPAANLWDVNLFIKDYLIKNLRHEFRNRPASAGGL